MRLAGYRFKHARSRLTTTTPSVRPNCTCVDSWSLAVDKGGQTLSRLAALVNSHDLSIPCTSKGNTKGFMRYTVQLGTDNDHDVPLGGALVGHILESLNTGAKKALRLALEGSSDIAGAYPRSLSRGAIYTVDGVEHFPSRIILNAPRIQDVITDAVFQDEIPLDMSAVGLFAEGMRDAIDGSTHSERVDDNLITTYLQLGREVERGVGAIAITNGQAAAAPVVLRPSSIERIREFKVQIPEPRFVRIAGTLNTIRHSDNAFSLIMPSGRTLKGVLVEKGSVSLKKFYGRQVIVSGQVTFRSSGRQLAIDATDIEAATAETAAEWSEEPRPLDGPGSNFIRLREQGPRSGLNAVFGQWPIETSDADFLRLTDDES